METLKDIYLFAWPAYLLIKYAALYVDREIRLNNEKTRYAYVKELGEGLLFNWRTLLWLYLLAI